MIKAFVCFFQTVISLNKFLVEFLTALVKTSLLTARTLGYLKKSYRMHSLAIYY